MKKNLNTPTLLKVLITVIACLIVALLLIRPTLTIPPAIFFAVIVGILPWFSPLFKSVEIPGIIKVEFNEKQSEVEAKAIANEAAKETSASQQIAIKWNKVATLFWLGNDLMWIEDQIYRGSGPERVTEGIDNVLLYMHDLGFAQNSLPIKEINIAKQILKGMRGLTPSGNNAFLLEQHYRSVLQNIQTVKWYIHALANNQQPDFEKLRAM